MLVCIHVPYITRINAYHLNTSLINDTSSKLSVSRFSHDIIKTVMNIAYMTFTFAINRKENLLAGLKLGDKIEICFEKQRRQGQFSSVWARNHCFVTICL